MLGFDGVRKGKKPRSGPRDAIEAEVRDLVAVAGTKDQAGDGKPWPQSWQKDSSGTGYQKSYKYLRWEEKKLQERTRHSERMRPPSRSYPPKPGQIRVPELLSLSQAGDVCSRSVFKRTAGPETTTGHPDAGNSPIIIRQGAGDKPPKRVANVLVSPTQGFDLDWLEYRPARVRVEV